MKTEALKLLVEALSLYETRTYGLVNKALAAGKEALAQPEQCNHQWVSAKNEVVQNGSVCIKCMTISPKEPHELAQPEQEPVAVRQSNGEIYVLGSALVPIGALLYTTPPQRTWVDLTDDEMLSLRSQVQEYTPLDSVKYGEAVQRAMAQALKEKNT